MLGDSGTGKSDILRSFLNPSREFRFEESTSTIGATYAIQNVLLDNENTQMKCKIWDTSGSLEAWHNVTVNLLR